MKVLSVRGWWALWMFIHALPGPKNVENRSGWKGAPSYRGAVAIHLSQGWTEREDTGFRALLQLRFGVDRPALLAAQAKLPWAPARFAELRGMIVGVVDLYAVRQGPLADRWYDGNQALGLCLRSPRPLAPVPWSGVLGLRDLPAEVVSQFAYLPLKGGG